MKFLIFTSIILSITSCVYDPPIKGKEIIIYNQSPNTIQVLVGLASGLQSKYCDTFSVNKRMYIGRNPNFISEYDQWDYFFRDSFRDKLEKNGIDSLILNINRISMDSLFRFSIDATEVLKISLADIESHEINRIFYYRDSIKYENEFNMEGYIKK